MAPTRITVAMMTGSPCMRGEGNMPPVMDRRGLSGRMEASMGMLRSARVTRTAVHRMVV